MRQTSSITRLRRGITTFGAATVIGAASLAMNAAPASAATVLGGIDMQRACTTQYPSSWGLVAKVLDQHNAYSWRCTAPWTTAYGIDTNRACADQYGSGASAGLRSSTDPYSWFCKR